MNALNKIDMKHMLFFLRLSLIFFSVTVVYAQRPCIKVNGVYPTPSTIAGEPPYAYRCASGTIPLEVVDCSGNVIDPSQYDSRVWHDSSLPRYDINGPISLDAPTSGVWTVIIEYTDPIFGTHTIDSAKVKLINYPKPAPADSLIIRDNLNVATDIYFHCKDDVMTFHATNSYYLPNSYKWYINNPATPLDTTTAVVGTGATFTAQIPTTKSVVVVATDPYGCKYRDRIGAPLKATPATPNLGADQVKCGGQSKLLKAYSVTPPPAPDSTNYRYSWNGGSETANSSFASSLSGNNTVVVSIFNNLASCKLYDTIFLSDYPAPNFTLDNDTSICYQAKGPLHAKSSSALTYTWTPATYFSGGNTGATTVIDFATAGLATYPISVTAKDANNCTAVKTINVTHLGQGSNPYMNLTAPPLNICNGSTKQFNTVATTTYTTTLKFEWTPSLHLNKDTAYRPVVDLTGEALNAPVTYSVKAIDSEGCYLTITTSATLVPSVIANVGFSDSSICGGNKITLLSSGTGGTGALTYAWSPAVDLDNASIPNPETTPAENRLYTVTISDSKGCSDSKTVDVKAINVVVELIPTDTSGYSAEPMVLDPTVNSTTYTYQWTNVTTSTSLGIDKSQVAEETGTYAVYATEPASGCHASDTINVTIQVGNPRLIYVPNVVNPASSNAENKTVKVYGTAVREDDFTFRIYNKWGEMIYETTSFSDANTNGWNGVYKTSNGTEQNLSVYTYSLHGKYFDGQEFNRTGSITLMR